MNFYVDPAYDEEHNVYTYAAIPSLNKNLCKFNWDLNETSFRIFKRIY